MVNGAISRSLVSHVFVQFLCFVCAQYCCLYLLYREALQNEYAPLSIDSWNQTLRKSQLFNASFARKKIRAPQKGRFEDQIAKIKKEWKKGQDLGLQDIVTLKLYTDFDLLQYSLVLSLSIYFVISR